MSAMEKLAASTLAVTRLSSRQRSRALQSSLQGSSAASATAVASNALEGRGAKADFFTTSRDPGSALMGFLSGKRMVSLYEAFRSAFIARGEGLSLHEFAQAVACSLPQEAIETLGEEGIAFEVVALFSAIDVNGDVSVALLPQGTPHAYALAQAFAGKACV